MKKQSKARSKARPKPKAKASDGKPGALLRWSLLRASVEFGASRQVIREGLAANGVEVVEGRGSKGFTTKQIAGAIFGDSKRERFLDLRARREEREQQLAKAAGDLIPKAEVEAIYGAALMPIRQRLLAMPREIAARCNPNAPASARAVLQAWVDSTLARIRKTLES